MWISLLFLIIQHVLQIIIENAHNKKTMKYNNELPKLIAYFEPH